LFVFYDDVYTRRYVFVEKKRKREKASIRLASLEEKFILLFVKMIFFFLFCFR